jgi:hypothetical protein
MRRVQRLNLHQHLEEVASQSSQGKKEKKTKRYTSNKTSLVCHCYRKKGHSVANCWYSEVCSFCGKKGHLVASCWEKQATCHKPNLLLEEEWKEDFPNPTTNSKAHGEKRSM